MRLCCVGRGLGEARRRPARARASRRERDGRTPTPDRLLAKAGTPTPGRVFRDQGRRPVRARSPTTTSLTYFALICVCCLAVLAASPALRALPATTAENGVGERGQSVPVLVELFTSEGCSSCPTADAALLTLASGHAVPGAEVIALEEHVDYWNHLGWTDPFSSRLFSLRQAEYRDALGGGAIYTPQMIVDGETELVGSDLARARQEIMRAAARRKVPVNVTALVNTVPDDTIRVRVAVGTVDGAPNQSELWVAITEDGLSTDVKGGENGGRRVLHGAIVRALQRVGSLDRRFAAETEVRISKDWTRERLRIVAFVQERGSHRVLGAATTSLAMHEG
jgi:hypothetical protein